MRTSESKSEAKTKLAQLETELIEKGPARLEAGKIAFPQLAEYVRAISFHSCYDLLTFKERHARNE